MSHFAKVENGIVTQVIVAEQDFIDSGVVGNNWIQTSYNTRGGIHYNPATNLPDNGTALRANYAGLGYIYDAENDVFYTSQPYPSWTISAPDWIWKAPIPYPDDGNKYIWNENVLTWDIINIPETTIG